MFFHELPHPGETLREDVLEPLHMTVGAAARNLGVTRTTLSRVLNGNAAISTSMAIRLEKAGIGTAETWVNLQAQYDLWKERQKPAPHVRPFAEKSGEIGFMPAE